MFSIEGIYSYMDTCRNWVTKREIVWKHDGLNCLSGVVNDSLSVGRWQFL